MQEQDVKVDGIIKDNLPENFEDMNLRKELLQGIKEVHAFSNPTPLQQRAIVPLIKGYDVVIQTHPGMGKKTTAAIAVLQSTDPDLRACQALIVSPSEKAAEKMMQVIVDMGENMKFHCHACITGNSIKNDIRKLKDGAQIVVGNFERIYDLISRKALRTDEIKIFAVEDASEMFSGIFRDGIQEIIKVLKRDVQFLLLSSVTRAKILPEFENILRYPAFSVINNKVQILRKEKHFYISVLNEHSKIDILNSLCDKVNIKRSVIFCHTTQKIDRIKKCLDGREFVVSTFHHGLCHKESDKVMEEFWSGDADILITNDVVLGPKVHTQQVSLIINYDFPTAKEKYVYIPEISRESSMHRKFVSFVTENEKQIIQEVEDFHKIKITELLMFDTDLYNALNPKNEHDCGTTRKDQKKYDNNQSCNDYAVGSFERMNLRQELLLGIYDYGFVKPKPLQQKAIPPFGKGYDVLICANQRAGKTTTLAIAALQNVDTHLRHCQALVLSSTRHDASHMLELLNELGSHMNCQCNVFIGGNHSRADIPKLEKCIHVAVGTAGRIYDLINRKWLTTSHIKMLILDETSVLFTKQQRDQTRSIFQALNSDIQIILSSTNVPEDAVTQFKKFLREPICIVTPKQEMNLTKVKQFYLPLIKENLIFETISNLYIKLTIPQSVIFCNRKHESDYPKDNMLLTVSTLFRSIESGKKDIIMKEFCSVCDHVLISTSFLNGEYKPPVSVIINYDFLVKKENYLHGIGKHDSYFHEDIIVYISESREMNVEKLKTFLS